MDDVVLEYQMTWNEFRRAQVRALPMRVVDLIGGVTLLCILIGVTDHEAGWTYYGIFFFVGFGFLATYVAPRRIWNSGLGFQEPVKVTISDQGIVRKSESLEMKLEWSRFQRVRETKEFFILMPRKKIGAYLILKRGLQSAVDENGLRQLLGLEGAAQVSVVGHLHRSLERGEERSDGRGDQAVTRRYVA